VAWVLVRQKAGHHRVERVGGSVMTTRNQVPRAQRIQSVLWIVAMLLLSVVVSGRSMAASRCPQQEAARQTRPAPVRTVATAAQADAGQPAPGYSTTGLDLEVRIWNVRIGFPWLKTLPVTPGRHIVVSLWETESDR
jgi:hypothetical protein